MHLEEIEQIQSFFPALNGSIVGVGMSAYPRITPALLFDRYTILTLRKTQDIPILRKKVNIFCLEEAVEGATSPYNSTRLLEQKEVKRFLKGLADPIRLIVYQSYAELEALAALEGWHLLANPFALRTKLSDRSFFKKALHRLQIPDVPGGLFLLEDWRKVGVSRLPKSIRRHILSLMNIKPRYLFTISISIVFGNNLIFMKSAGTNISTGTALS